MTPIPFPFPFSLFPGVAGLLVVAGCRGTLSPLSNRVAVAEEPYAVFVGDGEGGVGDLFAVGAGGGQVFQITFTRVDERAPALSPDGVMLAFLRAGGSENRAGPGVAVMNLLNGAERDFSLPNDAGTATRLAWSRDGRVIYIASSGGAYRVAAPPSDSSPSKVGAEEIPAGDSALSVILGEPPFARVITCAAGTGLCLENASGHAEPMAATGRDATRWGADSVGYFVGETFTVRPLGSGTARTLRWNRPPEHPRELVFFPGSGER